MQIEATKRMMLVNCIELTASGGLSHSLAFYRRGLRARQDANKPQFGGNDARHVCLMRVMTIRSAMARPYLAWVLMLILFGVEWCLLAWLVSSRVRMRMLLR